MIDPISIGASAAQGLLGIGQSIFGGIKAKKAQKQMGAMIDSYKPNESIMDYYSKALNRYNSNPYQSTEYQKNMQNAGRTTATGIGGLQDRRSAIGGISRLAGLQNDASINAGAQAESEQGQRLAQLGQATAMKVPEDKYKFEAKYNLLSAKAGAANKTANAGISNIFGGLGGIVDTYNTDTIYGAGEGIRKRPKVIIGGNNSGIPKDVPTRRKFKR
jgi:hypothetical protein